MTYLVFILVIVTCSFAKPIAANRVVSPFLVQHESALVKRTFYNLDDVKKADRRKFLEEAHKEAVDMARTALLHMKDKKYKHILRTWFGDRHDAGSKVEKVLKAYVGDNKKSQGSTVLSQVKVWDDDYNKNKAGTRFCDIVDENGKKGLAYFKFKNGEPAMHFCDRFFERKGKADFLKNKCGSIAEHINTDSTTRKYRGANVFHEFMHFPQVGEKG